MMPNTFLFNMRSFMIIAERTTSYGFLAAISGMHPIAIAQQGRTDLWPEGSILLPFKKFIQKHAFKKADLIHAWGPVMTISMKAIGVDMSKVLVLPKGIDLSLFSPTTNHSNKIEAIITRSLQPEYRHDSILKAFGILNQKGIDFSEEEEQAAKIAKEHGTRAFSSMDELAAQIEESVRQRVSALCAAFPVYPGM